MLALKRAVWVVDHVIAKFFLEMVIRYKKEGNHFIQKGESEDKSLKVIKSGNNKEGSQTFKHQNDYHSSQSQS